MNFKRILCLFTLVISLSITNGQNLRGMYVDGFRNILGNTASEDSLLNFAQANGINYLALYDLWPIHTTYNLTNASTCTVLANFIQRAKQNFGILQVGAVGENFFFFSNIIHLYNQQHTNALQKFDVYNVEFEFWNTNTVSSGNYYCTTYLQPGGFSCDTAGAFSYYAILLHQTDSLAGADGVISETYVGWFNPPQALTIGNSVDRILLHDYISNYAGLYTYIQPRLELLAARNVLTEVIPIFSAEPSFLGPWLSTHSISTPFSDLQGDFANETGSWKQYIHLQGSQWFAYSFLPYLLPTKNEAAEMGSSISFAPNPFQDFLDVKLLSHDAAEIRLYDLNGRLLLSSQLTGMERLNTNEFPGGMILWECIQNNRAIARGKLLKQSLLH